MTRHGTKLEQQRAGNVRPNPEKLSFTISETCAATGLGRTSIYDAINSGALKSARVCGRRLVLRQDLEAFLASGRELAANPSLSDDDEVRRTY
jgi:excisionase family DNA binding protein